MIYWCWFMAAIAVQAFIIHRSRKYLELEIHYLELEQLDKFDFYRTKFHEWNLISTYHLVVWLIGCSILLWYEFRWL